VNRRPSIVALALAALVLLLAAATSRAGTGPDLAEKAPELAQAGTVVRLPGLAIHGGTNKFIEATGKMALTDGILEFIAVEPNGRDYESLLTLDCRPSQLQFALMLIGADPGAAPQQAKPGEKIGSPLSLEMEWLANGTRKRLPIEQALVERRTKQPPAALPWVFSGSYFTTDPLSGRKVFQADQERAFIALWWEPSVQINLGGEYGDPYRGDNQGFEVRTAAVPAQGTPVTLILHLRQ
jgi:hypothetical protein